MSTQPSHYDAAIQGIGYAKLQHGRGWRRIVVEKPFGNDLYTARALNATLQKVFEEDKIYRIDHYLGKETVQNILAFRFGNGIFEPLWNRRYVNHVQITAAESIGVEGRGAYYQEAGALRGHDSESPVAGDGHDRDGAARQFSSPTSCGTSVRKLLRSIRIMKPEEPAVDSRRRTVRSGAHRRRGRSGLPPGAGRRCRTRKPILTRPSRFHRQLAMGRRTVLHSHAVSGCPSGLPISRFSLTPRRIRLSMTTKRRWSGSPNMLILRIQPEEGISLKFPFQASGGRNETAAGSMDFNYGSSFGERSPSAYETLLLDAMIGDATLYTRQDMVEASWAAVEPILITAIATNDFPNYAAGTWGPKAAEDMLARNGHTWRTP